MLTLAFFGTKRLVKWALKIQKEKALKREKELAKQKAKEKAEKNNIIEEKKQQLIQQAQSKPEEFILLLSSWMEVDQYENK